MVEPAFVFLWEVGEEPGARVARCARQALEPGPMGNHLRGADYQSFLEVWERANQLRSVKTSCAVFASAVLGHCGWTLRKPWHADGTWGITSWLNMGFGHRAWIDRREPDGSYNSPEVGDVFYRGSRTGGDGHVGVFVELLPSGKWRTAEGGGSLKPDEARRIRASLAKATNGTVCRLTGPEGKDPFASDPRPIQGWWRPSLMGLPEAVDTTADTEPAPPPSTP